MPRCSLLAYGIAIAFSCPLAAAEEELATVEGKVTFNGVAVPEGTITLHLKDGQFVGAKIKEGKYRIDRVPVTTVAVTIESKKFKLPQKYAAPDTSGLMIEVKKGKSTFDIDLIQ
jgi:hypothetical protein